MSKYDRFKKAIDCLPNHEMLRFIQVGAFDGIGRHDPISAMILSNNWSGILIEPLSDQFKKLRSNYGHKKNLIFKNIAIHPSKKSVDIYSHPRWPSQSSLLRNAGRLKKLSDKKVIKSRVRCMTLDEVVNEHQFFDIDLLQIDVEGFDFEVIKTLSIPKHTPKYIHYEHRHLGDAKNKCENWLKKRGYKIKRSTLEDTLAVYG